MVYTFWFSEIDGCNAMSTEMDRPDAIVGRRPEGNCVGAKGLSEPKDVAVEGDFSFGLDLPDLVAAVVVDRRQAFWIGPRADLVAAGRGGHPQCLMGALAVVDVTPAGEVSLAISNIREGASTEQFHLERAVEPLVFALGLGMARATVVDSNADLPQPHAELGGLSCTAPGASVVGNDRDGQSVPTKDLREFPLDGLGPLIQTRLQPETEPGVIVEHREGMAPPHEQGEMPLEIHLPELVRGVSLKTLPGLMLRPRNRLHTSVTPQDHCDRARTGHATVAACHQASTQLPPTPRRMALSLFQHHRLQLVRSTSRRVVRPAGAVGEPSCSSNPIAGQPLVAGRRANPGPPAQLPNIRAILGRQIHKFTSQRHRRRLLPRHAVSQSRTSCLV